MPVYIAVAYIGVEQTYVGTDKERVILLIVSDVTRYKIRSEACQMVVFKPPFDKGDELLPVYGCILFLTGCCYTGDIGYRLNLFHSINCFVFYLSMFPQAGISRL
jgi:hypothetical protein